MTHNQINQFLIEKRNRLEFDIISTIYFNLDLIEVLMNHITRDDFSIKNGDIFDAIEKKYNGEISIEDFEETCWQKYDMIEMQTTHESIMEQTKYAKNGIEALFLRRVLLLKETLLRMSVIKRLLDTVNKMVVGDIFDSVNELNVEAEKITSNALSSSYNQTKSFRDLVDDVYLEIKNELDGNAQETINSRYYGRFNEITGGLKKGNLVGIAGAWKNGKTSFAINLALDFAEQGISVGVLSLEMSDGEVARKLIASISNVSYMKLRNPKDFEPHEKEELKKVNKDLPIEVVSKSITISEVSNKIAELAKKGCEVITIDYIGLIQMKSDNSWNKHNEISSLIKSLAKRHNVIILLLAQLNRAGVKNASSDNLADGIGLARDSDFFFTVQLDEVSKKFIVKLDRSRHSEAGGRFALEMLDGGRMNISDLPKSIKNNDDLPI